LVVAPWMETDNESLIPPTFFRSPILRNETGVDPGSQHCAKYRVLVLSRG